MMRVDYKKRETKDVDLISHNIKSLYKSVRLYTTAVLLHWTAVCR